MIENKTTINGLTEVLNTGQQKIANLAIFLCNADTKNADVVDVYVVKNGEAPSASNKVIAKLYIPPVQTFSLEEKLIFEAGDSLWVEAQVGGRVTVTVTYTDI
jgi:hypothetical protein